MDFEKLIIAFALLAVLFSVVFVGYGFMVAGSSPMGTGSLAHSFLHNCGRNCDLKELAMNNECKHSQF